MMLPGGSIKKESTLRSIIHLDKLLKKTQEKRSIERTYLNKNLDNNKGIDITQSTYYQSKFPDPTANKPISREEYFKGHVSNAASL